MGIIVLRSKTDVSELMEKAHKAKKHVCDLVEELEDTVEEMHEQYGEENYRYDRGYRGYDRMYRDDSDRMYREDRSYHGGRYDYRRY
ncbi:MAG: hypothetical protein IJ213_04880 [Bacteroidales bacterium]|nr:hypothetical protein [Bacteroidales bacterium]